MLRSGKEHLETLRDGRVVYVGSERVDDVTRHPAFRDAAQTVAAIYDMKADPATRDVMTYEEDGGRHSIYYLRARSREDLERRMRGHRRIADLTLGMFGRSPDHVASFVTGMAMKPDALPAPFAHADNLLRYYRHLRDNDVYVVYAVLPPQAARNPEFYERQNIPVPTLRVVPNPRVAQYGMVESIGWTLPIDDVSFRIYVVGRVKRSGDIGRMRSKFNGKFWWDMTEEEHQRFPGDYEAQVGQGPITFHSEEHLMTTDQGVGMLRFLLQKQVDAVAAGGDPVGVAFSEADAYVKFDAGQYLED